eukprot:4255667-Amphidinium_carterae.1
MSQCPRARLRKSRVSGLWVACPATMMALWGQWTTPFQRRRCYRDGSQYFKQPSKTGENHHKEQ